MQWKDVVKCTAGCVNIFALADTTPLVYTNWDTPEFHENLKWVLRGGAEHDKRVSLATALLRTGARYNDGYLDGNCRMLALGVLLVWMVAGEAPRPAAGGGIALPAAFKEHASDGVRALANRLLRADAERRPAAPRVVDDAARLLRKQPPAPVGSASIDSTRRDASNTSSMDDMSSTDVARALRLASA